MSKNISRDFYEQEVLPLSKSGLFHLGIYCSEHTEKIENEFLDGIRRLCIMIKEMQCNNVKKKISYIVVSALRISILDKSYRCRIDAYDSSFYADENECTVEFDGSCYFGYMGEMLEELTLKKKDYFNKIKEYEIDGMVLNELNKFTKALIHLGRYIGNKIEDITEFGLIDKNETLEIRIGEYWDVTYPVYTYLEKLQDSDEVKQKLKDKGKFYYKPFRNLDLSGESFEGVELCFCDFSRSNISNCNFSKSNLTGALMRECKLENTNFSNCILNGSIFSGTDISNTNFTNAELKNVIW